MRLGMGLFPGQGFGNSTVALNFSALTALPTGRQSAVAAAAALAAATLGVTSQSIVDALSVGRGLASLLPNDGCLLSSSGGAVTVQGDPVGAFRSWTGVELATQSNSTLRGVSAALGLSVDGSKLMSLPGLSAGNLEAIAVLDPVNSSAHGLWTIGTNSDTWMPISNTALYDSFGTSTRLQNLALSSLYNKAIYQPFLQSNTLTLLWNGISVASQGGLTNSLAATPVLFQPLVTTGFNYNGILSALALNLTNYTVAQRAAVREFCRNYYGVTY